MITRDERTRPEQDGAPGQEAAEGGASLPAPVRIVAKIVDPSVREDGRGDPQLVFERSADPPAARRPVAGSHPVRDRLLARAHSALTANDESARAARAHRGAPPPQDWDLLEAAPAEADAPEGGADALPELADDLDLIGAPERPRPQRAPHAAPALPAPVSLLLGTLGGLIAIAVLFAALLRLDPHEPLATTAAAARPAPAPELAGSEPAESERAGSGQAGLDGRAAASEQAAPTAASATALQQSAARRRDRPRRPQPWRLTNGAAAPDVKLVGGSVGRQPFLVAAQAAGIARKQAYRILTSFEGLKNLDRCRPRDTFAALVQRDTGRVTAFEYTVSEEEVYQARDNGEGRLIARLLDLDVQRKRAGGVIVISGSFDESARRAGFQSGLGDVVDKALSGYVRTTELRPGDALGVVAQEVTVLGEFSRYAGVEALEYRPVSGEPLRVYYHESARGYIDSKGRAFGKSRFSRPVPGARVTSRFNPRRMHPILRRIKPHNGIDFGAPTGTVVQASGAGRVTFVGRAGPNGNMITLAHPGSIQTGYSHLSRFAKGLKVGAKVEQRQVIGYVGSTGRSTGPHLHFSAKKSGRFIDPETLNLDGLARLTNDDGLKPELRAKYDQMLDALRLPSSTPAREQRAEASAGLAEPPLAREPAPAPAQAPSLAAASAGEARRDPAAAAPAAPQRPPALGPHEPVASRGAPSPEPAVPPGRGSPFSAALSGRAPAEPRPPYAPPMSVSLEPEPSEVLMLPPEQALPQPPSRVR